jgi:hypothetical protein
MKKGFFRDILTGIITSIIVGVAVYLYDIKFIQHFYVLLIIVFLVIVIIALVILLFRSYRNNHGNPISVSFHSILTPEKIKKIIASAKEELWAFQISGGHHTRLLTDVYRDWLVVDNQRKLKILFINPEKSELVMAVGVLLGRVSVDDNGNPEVRNFLDEINRTIKIYQSLRELFPNQVELRLYDCCPPCSILGCDLYSAIKERQKMVVENYLFDLPWSKRPCFTLTARHAYLLENYKTSLKCFFENGKLR